MSKKKKILPELRFPEFKNEGEWEEIELGNVFIERQENGYNDLPLLSLTEKGGIIPQEETNRKNNSSADKTKYLRVCVGDVAYNTMRMWEGRSAYVVIEGVVSPAYTVCQPKEGNSGLFFSYYFKTSQLIQQFHRYSQGLVKDTLNLKYEAFSRIRILKPKIQEQQHIASTLLSIDEVITTHTEKLELLKDHKKGLMQNLFPQDGEKVPKYRFKKFLKDGDWRYLNGDILFDSISDRNHNSDLPILAITQEYGAVPRDQINYTVIATENSIGSYKIVEKGDFVISLRSFQGGIEYSNYRGICSPAYVILRKKIMLDDMFFRYYFKSDLYIKQLNINIEGIRDGKMVSYKQFSEILLPFPSIEEQKMIAACLNSLEETIKAQSEMIEQLKMHKKGLMQSLFPKTID